VRKARDLQRKAAQLLKLLPDTDFRQRLEALAALAKTPPPPQQVCLHSHREC
jgi:hypothetical protein